MTWLKLLLILKLYNVHSPAHFFSFPFRERRRRRRNPWKFAIGGSCSETTLVYHVFSLLQFNDSHHKTLSPFLTSAAEVSSRERQSTWMPEGKSERRITTGKKTQTPKTQNITGVIISYVCMERDKTSTAKISSYGTIYGEMDRALYMGLQDKSFHQMCRQTYMK